MIVNMQRDLVVGGSGMLLGLCESLTKSGRHVSVFCRNGEPIKQLVKGSDLPSNALEHIRVDYSDEGALERALNKVTSAGLFDRVVCWVHPDVAPNAPLLIARYTKTSFCHVQSSMLADPAKPDVLETWQNNFAKYYPDLNYQTVILGFEKTGFGTRWLTDSEISNGVVSALETPEKKLIVVGHITPWADRP